MADPYLGEIKLMSFSFAPRGWTQCNGQLLPINQNQALFSLLGTTYGGNGQTTFGLPDLRSRSPYHVGNGFSQGQRGGEQSHTLTMSEMPSHNHVVNASSASGNLVPPATGGGSPQHNIWAVTTQNPYIADLSTGANSMDPGCVSLIGGGQPHLNMQPYLVINFCIALVGIFPSRN